MNSETGDVIVPAKRRITKTLIREIAENASHIEIDPSPIRIQIMSVITEYAPSAL